MQAYNARLFLCLLVSITPATGMAKDAPESHAARQH